VRILVVDDRFQSRWSIADGLSVFLAPVAVDSAASAREALPAIAKRKPDLVLAAHPMLVVVMTEQSDARFESACDAAGADFWLEKRHLQARLLAFLQQRFSLRALRHSPFF